jgi:hypothetical protein
LKTNSHYRRDMPLSGRHVNMSSQPTTLTVAMITSNRAKKHPGDAKPSFLPSPDLPIEETASEFVLPECSSSPWRASRSLRCRVISPPQMFFTPINCISKIKTELLSRYFLTKKAKHTSQPAVSPDHFKVSRAQIPRLAPSLSSSRLFFSA